MAITSISISPGVGPAIATRDIGGSHRQLMEDAAATTLTASQVTVTTASTAIVAENANRRVAIIQVVAGGPVYIRGGVATTNDFPLATGGVYEHANTAALSGIVASGTADVRILEEE